MTKFWELFRTSVVLQFSLALLVSLTVCALYLMGRDVPLELVGAWMLILGFVFGQKVGIRPTRDRGNG